MSVHATGTADPSSDAPPLELQLSRPEDGPAAYLGPHLAALISNRGEDPAGLHRVRLIGAQSQTEVTELTGVPVSVAPGGSVRFAVNLTWQMVRRLRRDGGVVLEVERDNGQAVRSDALDVGDVKTWTPGQELKAVVGALVLAIAWWFFFWMALFDLSPTLRAIAWPLDALLAAFVCSQFYVRLWRGEPMWGTGLTIGMQRRVRPLTDVLLTSLVVWVILTAPFAFATYLIERHHLGVGGVGTLFTGDRERYFEAIGLYAWHAVDVLPFVQATTTLHWTEPVRDYGRATGGLLVLYKALVLAPVVAAAVAAWRARARREPRAQEAGHTP